MDTIESMGIRGMKSGPRAGDGLVAPPARRPAQNRLSVAAARRIAGSTRPTTRRPAPATEDRGGRSLLTGKDLPVGKRVAVPGGFQTRLPDGRIRTEGQQACAAHMRAIRLELAEKFEAAMREVRDAR
jgi:hypothetical protein